MVDEVSAQDVPGCNPRSGLRGRGAGASCQSSVGAKQAARLDGVVDEALSLLPRANERPVEERAEAVRKVAQPVLDDFERKSGQRDSSS